MSRWHPSARSFVDVLRAQAAHLGDRRAFTFLANGEDEADALTFAELDRAARALAGMLQARVSRGDRALLLYPPGLDFIRAFMACLYAGVVAVPAYPPRRNRTVDRLRAIAVDAAPAIALVARDVATAIARSDEAALGIPVLVADAEAAQGADPDAWRPEPLAEDDLAFLQYTSGSTGTPKGVMVTHGNILQNSEVIRVGFGHDAHSVFVSWLPVFHDMGLIGKVIQPLYVGVPSVLMEPAAFLQKPVRWLRAITRYRGTTSGAPNSAYELCVRKVSESDRQGLDLSSWESAFNGAEPVRASTLERFREAFTPHGLRPEFLRPCYGMAETTLLVSIGPLGLAAAVWAQDGARWVSSGRPWLDTRVVIVDPDRQTRLTDGAVGEIWIAGGSVAAGYWRRTDETVATFGARTSDGDGPFLRTGDLGFQRDGELCVTGRLKDLIISRGRNVYPQDVEYSAGTAHPALSPDATAAFGIDSEETGTDALVVVCEVAREHLARLDAEAVVEAVRAQVSTDHDLDPAVIVLLRTLGLPKTSSGKTQRRLCRTQWEAGQLTVLHEWRRPVPVPTSVPVAETSDAVRAWLVAQMAALSGVDAARIDVDAPFARYGIDSQQAVELSGRLAEWLQRPLAATLAYDYPTIDALASHLGGAERVTASRDGARDGDEPIAVVGIGCRLPGASSPDAFWTLLADAGDAIRMPPAGRPGGEALGPAGYLDGVEQFDAAFFGITPREAEVMDPQQRLVLEVAWEALEDAGMVPAHLAGSQTGVFIGISGIDYARAQGGSDAAADPYAATGTALSLAANRLSYLLDLRGPSWAVDTACSSSLVAVQHACDSLRQQTSDVALAGGVNLVLTPQLTDVFTRAGMLSPSARCRTFDADANGYVRGEGAGVVVLKRWSDAKRDGDTVHALIRGAAVNQDGRTNGLTAPNGPAQEAVIRAALASAGLHPTDISYVEAHGTGTPLGDPIEVQALVRVLGDGRPPQMPCVIGSVKTNIGHLEAAAGIAGLIKVVLALRHGEIPPHLHFSTLNPHIPIDGTPFIVPTARTPWPATRGPRRAGVSAFGFGGTNCHVVLEEAPVAATGPTMTTPSAHRSADPCRLPVSARTPTALRAAVTQLATFLTAHPELSLAAVASTLQHGRTAWPCRAEVVAATIEEAAVALRALATTPDALDVAPAPQATTTGAGPATGLTVQTPAPRVPPVSLPTYPFERARYWYDGGAVPRDRTATDTPPLAQSLSPLAPPRLSRASSLRSRGADGAPGGMKFGVMFFAASALAAGDDPYRLVLESARFADRAGFSSLWVPERHFTEFGGLYPNPAVLQAAVAASTSRIGLRAGSVVAPLHHPLRCVEEWSVVDNLSRGRVGVSFAAGWNPDDFVLAPEVYATRHDRLYEVMREVQALWRGAHHDGTNGVGQPTRVRAYPRPVQTDLPVWATVAGNPEHFRRAGASGAHLLTHLLDQDVEVLAERIRIYRDARAAAGLDPATAEVTVMLHTFVGADADTVRAQARGPYCEYIKANIGLFSGLARSRGHEVDLRTLSASDLDDFTQFLYDRFAATRGLIGTPESCAPLVERLHQIGVTELACLLDFGPSTDVILAHLPHLEALMRRVQGAAEGGRAGAAAYRRTWHQVTRSQPTDAEAGEPEAIGDGASTVIAVLTADPRMAEPFRAALLARGVQTTADLGTPAIRGIVDLRGLSLTWDAHRETLAAGAQVESGVRDALQLACDSRATAPVWFVTRGALAGPEHDAVAGQPAQAALWGLGRAVAVERPGALGGLVDLDPSASDEENAASLASLVRSARDGDDMFAVRDGQVWVPRLERVSPSAASHRSLTFSSDETVLVTGGTGGLGLCLARWVVERGARHLLLVARGVPGDEARRDIDTLSANGVDVAAIQADVADEVALSAALNAALARRPPLTSVFHLAGIVDDARLEGQDDARIRRVLRPKVDGTWALHRATRTAPLRHFVLFSSVSAWLPAPGQANYAAANACLEGLAAWRRAHGLPALVVQWGPWADVGHAAQDYGRAAHARLAAMGIHALAPENGLQWLEALISDDCSDVAVADIDWARLVEADPLAARLPLLGPLVATGPGHHVTLDRASAAVRVASSRASETAAGAPADAPSSAEVLSVTSTPFVEALRTLPASARRPRVLRALSDLVVAALRLRTDTPVDPQQRLFDLGVDSIVALELRAHVERLVGLPLSATLLFVHPTLDSLAEHLLAQLATALATTHDTASDNRTTADLTDDELLRRLRDEIAGARGD